MTQEQKNIDWQKDDAHWTIRMYLIDEMTAIEKDLEKYTAIVARLQNRLQKTKETLNQLKILKK